MILVHNHPSGHTHPSEDDQRLTGAVSKAAAPLDIRVVDHIIVGKGDTFPFVKKVRRPPGAA